MQKQALAVIGLLMGMGVAAPAAADDWRACVVGACLLSSCGDNDASVVVSMGTNVDDPAVGGTAGLQRTLLRQLEMRNQGINGQPMMQCTPPQASQSAADQMAQNIFAQMRTSFRDVTLRSANDMISGYDSTPGSEDPRYNGGGSDNQAAQAAAAAAQREREAAQRERERQAQQAEAQRQRDAADAQQRMADEQRRARERERAAAAATQSASTASDARTCVSAPVLQQNATFQGNTAASVVNGCGTPVDVRICLMRDTGWNCGMTNGLAPQASWSWSSFRVTGGVFMDARVTGSGRTLGSP
ncbi:MAG: hypothetical protein EOP93_17585 [Lysobacteraceae bacterium]|nr:MAG: hypothetical protein EOP93_17585 [Xanthomonadaceae bacterium]